jgi:hypothetical protein
MAVFFERMLAKADSDATSQDDDDERVSLPIAIGSHPDHAERIRFFREWRADF